jgi:hypothetical protein
LSIECKQSARRKIIGMHSGRHKQSMLTGIPRGAAIVSRGCNGTGVFFPNAIPDRLAAMALPLAANTPIIALFFLLNAAMLNKRTENLLVLCKAKFHEQAKENGWSPAHTEGYFAGASIRRRGEPLSRYALVGIDEYCMGLRAGYFGRQHRADFSVRAPGAFAMTDVGSAAVTAREQA